MAAAELSSILLYFFIIQTLVGTQSYQ